MDKSVIADFWKKAAPVCKPWLEAILQAAALALALFFLLWPVVVDGASMEATLQNGDRAIMSRVLIKFNQFDNGSIVVIKPKNEGGDHLIKRLIASPGDHLVISGGAVYLNEALLAEEYLEDNTYTIGDLNITLGDDEYFVMGDNRTVSRDSRSFGVIKKSEITGKVLFRFWPFNKINGL